ncbi:MAG: polymerase [Patescibacteria group bacterium]|nr:polymerase [Patescibacteria group bacterium]
MKENKEKLIIIDGNAVIHRSFHALPPTLRTRDGILVNAVYGFTSFLIKAITEFKPQYVILTLDKAGPTFRHEAYSQYKATRVKAADELYEQIPLVKEVANAFAIPIFEKSGFEADDLIGSLTQKLEKEKTIETIIVTGDLDTLQLINPQTKVYTMSRGLTDSVLYDENKVKERYNLSPQQIIDYKALAGDASDNIPGAKGIGEKTAIELLIKFGTIEKLFAAIDRGDSNLKERTLKLLEESRNNVFLSKQLATIDQTVDLDFSLENAKFSPLDKKTLTALFSRLEFKSLMTKLDSLVPNTLPKKEEKKKKEKLKITTLGEPKANDTFIKQAKKEKQFSIFLAQTDWSTKIFGFALSFKTGNNFFLPFKEENIISLKTIWEDKKILKIGHDLKIIWKIFKTHNIELNGLYFDTLLASYLLNPGERKYRLENLFFSELGLNINEVSDEKNIKKSQLSLDFDVDWKKISATACQQSNLILQLYEKLTEKLKTEDLMSVFTNLEMPLLSILGRMEYQGIKVEAKILDDLDKKTKEKIKILETKIQKLVGQKFNVSSPKQLKEVLFDILKISTTGLKKTKTGYSTAEDELNKIYSLHPVIPLILEHRELTKLETTYLNTLPKIINPKTKRIHTTFSQVTTATGRLSSHDPNLQNIPTKTKEGREIRSAFVAEKGYILISFDYSQIELRLAAHFSKDKTMLAAFKKQTDIHAETAAKINEVALSDVTTKMRNEAKAINFGVLYGQGPHGLSQNANISYARAKEFIDKYFITYPRIKKMVDSFIVEAQEKGYATTLFGRKRYLPDINSSLNVVKKGAERMAINTPIQGTAADIIKQVMIKIEEKIKNENDTIRLLLQIHDELIFEVKEELASKYINQITTIMQTNFNLLVPLVVQVTKGKNWKELK